MATQEDRSLKSGISIPRWMKIKMNDKLDFEQSAFSPTELDDSFILYSRKFRENTEMTNSSDEMKSNFTKHTLPCQKFLNNIFEVREAQKIQDPVSSSTKVKSSGIDDGFKGEASKCGSSVIRVAHQMVANNVMKNFHMKQNDCTNDMPPEGFNSTIRRGSKSLPSSPLTSPNSSPKTKRRLNKYFTGAFTDTDKHHGSWILSNLLSQRQALSQSFGFIAEEERQVDDNIKKYQSNISIDDIGERNKKQMFVPKPSELREMNFWSPTSM